MRLHPMLCFPLALAACADPIAPSGYDGADRSDLAALAGTNVQGFDTHQVDVNGITSDYNTYVSSGAAGNTPVPVVFMFHGTGQDADNFFDDSYVPGGPDTWGWVATAEANDFIVVFPQALKYCYEEDGSNRITTKWASGKLGPAPAERELCDAAELAMFSPAQQAAANHPFRDDMAFFDEMLAQIQVDFAVDTDRIYVAGFSNGGQMASRIAVERSEEIAAGSGSGCSLEITPVAATRPMSFAFTIGSKDDRFTPLNGGNDLPVDDEDFIFHPVTGAPMVLVQDYLTAFQLDGTTYTFVSTAIPTPGPLAKDDHARWTFSTSTAVPAESNALTVGIIEGLYHQYPNGVNHPMNLSDVLWNNLFVNESL
jgi:poly(3-hydroxybutyrate) depolymerase